MRLGFISVLFASISLAACSGGGGADVVDVAHADVTDIQPPTDVPTDSTLDAADASVDTPAADTSTDAIDTPTLDTACPVSCGDFRCAHCAAGCCDQLRDAGTDASDVASDGPRPNCADGDGDGYGVGSGCLGPDCDDANPAVHPGARELCDGIDEDCDGSRDDNPDAPSLDVYCADTYRGPMTWLLPPRCIYPSFNGDPGYQRLTNATRCETCRRDESNPSQLICTCWINTDGYGLCPYP